MAERIVKIVGGRIEFIYGDKMRPFLDLGKAEVKRASHVEPSTVDGSIKWFADLSPVGGPTLGPFDERQDALDQEVEWLNQNHLQTA